MSVVVSSGVKVWVQQDEQWVASDGPWRRDFLFLEQDVVLGETRTVEVLVEVVVVVLLLDTVSEDVLRSFVGETSPVPRFLDPLR